MTKNARKLLGTMTMAALVFAVQASTVTSLKAQESPAQVRSEKLGTIISGYKQPKRITIIKSLSCGFCKVLDRQLVPKEAINLQKKGYEIEIVPVHLSRQDRVTTAILTCGSVKGFASRMRRLYNGSGTYSQATQTEAETRAMARHADYGLSKKKLANCLTEQNYRKGDQTTQRAKGIYGFEGTPSIYLNGKLIGHNIQDLTKLP